MSTQEVVAYEPVKAALADLRVKYSNVVFDVTTAAGLVVAKAAYKDINQYSVALENARVKEKADSLAFGRFIDSEAKRIAEQLDALRLPIKEQIDEVAKKEQREREAAIEAEKRRILAEQEAARVAEERKMAEARAEIARQQAEIVRQQREAEDAARASRARIEQEERAARLIREEADRASRAIRDEADRAAQVTRDHLAAERAEQDRALREESDRLEGERREIERQQTEIDDGKTILRKFVERFGRRREFYAVVQSIQIYLVKTEEAA